MNDGELCHSLYSSFPTAHCSTCVGSVPSAHRHKKAQFQEKYTDNHSTVLIERKINKPTKINAIGEHKYWQLAKSAG